MRDYGLIRTACQYAWQLVGKPYVWGGDDPMRGFDCSGLVIEILRAVGRLPEVFDCRAKDLFSRWELVYKPMSGCLVFWGNYGNISHVEFCIDDAVSIGASGGGSKTLTLQDAINQNAYIKPRPISREDWRERYYNDPFLVENEGRG